MGKAIDFSSIFPIYKVEHGAIVSMQGDLTVAFRVDHAGLFTLGSAEYEAAHHVWIKAIKSLPYNTVLHKQDRFFRRSHEADVSSDQTFLTRSGESEFSGLPYLSHSCVLMLTKKADDRRSATSGYSGLMRKSIVPQQGLGRLHFADFMEKVGAFERILSDSGLFSLRMLGDEELAGNAGSAGIIESYCYLLGDGGLPVLKDVGLSDGIKVGTDHVQLFTLADAEHLPSLVGSRVNYDRYSTDKS
ncbi:MAG: DUF3875 domain-containing protein, partial [Sphingobacteriales bacterium]